MTEKQDSTTYPASDLQPAAESGPPTSPDDPHWKETPGSEYEPTKWRSVPGASFMEGTLFSHIGLDVSEKHLQLPGDAPIGHTILWGIHLTPKITDDGTQEDKPTEELVKKAHALILAHGPSKYANSTYWNTDWRPTKHAMLHHLDWMPDRYEEYERTGTWEARNMTARSSNAAAETVLERCEEKPCACDLSCDARLQECNRLSHFPGAKMSVWVKQMD